MRDVVGELGFRSNIVTLGALGPVVARPGVEDRGRVSGSRWCRVRIRNARVTEPNRLASGSGTEVAKIAFETVSS